MSLPVINLAQMREWETATWATGQTEAEVIRRVGLKIASRALELTQSRDLILLLAGKGHNGDDVRAAAEHLVDRRVESLNVQAPDADLLRLESLLAQHPALIVDGLFGIGLNRPLDAAWIQFIQRVNGSKVPVLAVDVPSGLNAETGKPEGAAIEAAITLTVGAPKAGLLAQSAWPFVGRLEVAEDVGLAACPHKSELNWISRQDLERFPPRRQVASHKGTFGHLAIVAGSRGYHGAAILAARGAHRAQPGLVTLFTHPETYHPIAAQLQSAMVSPWEATVKFIDYTALLYGPGLAANNLPDELKLTLRRLWLGATMPMVVDASALDWVPLGIVPPNFVRVLTPHPGEAARLLKGNVQQVLADRPQAVREISRRFGNAWVVLKGHQTMIGRSTGEIWVNSTGNPQLAQGGSGDLLAGYIAGLLAQPDLQADPLKTISYAVWQHGAAADKLSREHKNWVVEELAAAIGSV